MGREAEAQAAVQSTLLGEALDHASLAAFVLDDQGRHVAVNRAACDLIGCERDDLLDHAVQQLVPAEGSGGVVELERRDGSTVTVEYRTAETTIGTIPFFLALCWRK